MCGIFGQVATVNLRLFKMLLEEFENLSETQWQTPKYTCTRIKVKTNKLH